MYRGDKMKYYTIHEMTEILGVTAQTLRNWDKSGKLKPHHTSPNGYRYYSEDDLNQLLNKACKKTRENGGLLPCQFAKTQRRPAKTD